MSPPLAVLCPLYKRVERLPALAENLRETTPEAVLLLRRIPDVTPPADIDIGGNMVGYQSRTTGYAEGINLLARHARAGGFDWLFVGADDLRFHPGWYEEALRVAKETGASVIGTNDMHNPRVLVGRHSTHFLVRADYLDQGTVDQPNAIMSEAYGHDCVDDELRATAIKRGVYAHAHNSKVEHLHPEWGLAEMDETYEHGAYANMDADIELLKERLGRFDLWDAYAERT